MQLPPHVKRVLLTGGAGFIGSHVLDLLAPSGVHFTVYDNLTNGKLDYIESHLVAPECHLREGGYSRSRASDRSDARP